MFVLDNMVLMCFLMLGIALIVASFNFKGHTHLVFIIGMLFFVASMAGIVGGGWFNSSLM